MNRNIRLFILAIVIFSVSVQCSKKENIELEEDDWAFVVFGDIRMGYGVYSKLVLGMSQVEPAPSLAICGGDVMNHGSNEVEWSMFWDYSRPLTEKMPIHITRGNHEGNSEGDARIFRQQLKSANEHFYYSFTEKNARFIILDTEIPGEVMGVLNEQLEWLKAELKKAEYDPEIEHVFLSLHRPLFPKGGHEGEDMVNAYELHDLFLQHDKVKAVFVSHDHLFNKYFRDGIPYITSGGGGGPLHRDKGGDYYHYVLISINEKTQRINLKTIGLFNEVIEDFDL